MQDTFFDQAGDRRMENSNIEKWTALYTHIEKDINGGSLEPNGIHHILDIGCHTGGLLKLLQRKMKWVDTFSGVEPIEKCRETAARLLPNGRFYQSIEEVADKSIDLIVSHETLYLVEDLDSWCYDLNRVLKSKGVAYIILGSHGENTAWMRWKPRLEELYGHKSYAHWPIDILQAGDAVGFSMERRHLYITPKTSFYYTDFEDGWGEFESAEEENKFYNNKYVFVFWPKG